MKKDVLFSSTMAIATPRRSSQLQLMPYNHTIINCNSTNQQADELFPAEELVPISHSLIPTALANLFNLNLPPSAASPPPSKPVNHIQIASSPNAPAAAPAAIAKSPLPHNHTVDRAEPDMAARVLEHTAPTASCCNSGTPDLDPSDEICPKPQAACTSASAYHDHESAASMKAEYQDMVLANKQAQAGPQQQHHHSHSHSRHHHHHHHNHGSRRNAEMQQEIGNGGGECAEMGMMGGGHGGCKRQQQHDGMDEYGLDEMGADMELSSMMMGHMGEKESSSNSGDGDGMDGGGGTGCTAGGGVSTGGGGAARTLKRPRLVWTPQLHKRFVDAVSHLGIRNAVPKTIMQLMNVGGLTRENVASHLQKYRLYLRRMQQGSLLFSSSPTSAALLTSTTSCSKPIIMNHHQLAAISSSTTTTTTTTNDQFPASPTSDALFSGAAHGHGHPQGDPTSTARAQLLVPHHRTHSAAGPVIHPNPAPNHAIKNNDHLGMHPPVNNALILHSHPLNNHNNNNNNNNPQQLNPAAILNNPSVLTNPNDQASFLFNPVTSCNQSMQPPPPPSPPNRGVNANPSPTSNWMTPSPNLNPSATPQIQLDPYNNRHNHHHHHHHEPHRPLAFNLEPPSKQLIASPPSPPRVALALFPQ